MFNFGQAASLLSAVNPFSWLKTLYIWLGIAAISFLMGFFSGCEYKQNQWDAEKFRGMEKAKKLEKQDTAAGAKKVEELAGDKKQIDEGKGFVKENLGKKPLVRVIESLKQDCPVEVITQEGTKKSETIPGVYLTAHFQRMHDVSARPRNVELRTRTYEEEHTVGIDEGLTLVTKNYGICAEDQARLDRLIERIQQKQRIFKGE